MADGVRVLVHQLQRNNPTTVPLPVRFYLDEFQNDANVVQVAQALRVNEWVDEFCFYFDEGEEQQELSLNWEPLLQELSAREKLKDVVIRGGAPTGNKLLPLFRDHFFQALGQNANLQFVEFDSVEFSSHSTEGIVSFLEGTPPALTDLSFAWCEYSTAENRSNRARNDNIWAALHRNNRIQNLKVTYCGADFLCPLFQGLAASESSASRLTKLVYHVREDGWRLEERAPIAEAIQEYLESPHSTIECLQLECVFFSRRAGSASILRGLSRNTSITELAFSGCFIGPYYFDDEDEDDEQDAQGQAQQLANLIREKLNLSTLRVTNCNFFEFQQFTDTIVGILRQRESPLRCLEFDVVSHWPSGSTPISLPALTTLLTAITTSIRLKQLIVKRINPYQDVLVQNLVEAIPLFKINRLTLSFLMTFQEERFLAALKRNFFLQCVEFESELGRYSWFSDENQHRLEFSIDRNKKLAQWSENPKLVPRELWSYAVMLALEAGINSLFQSLISLSGQGIGLKQRQGRKRKRPQYYRPS